MADQLRQQRRLDHRGDADAHFRHAEHRAVAGDAEIAGGGELKAGAERVAVDPRDRRHRQMAERVAADVDGADEGAGAVGIERRELVDIGAADKGASAGAAHHRQPQLRVGGEPGHRLDDLGHQRAVERVELGGAVDGDPRDEAAFRPLFPFDADAHSALPGTCCVC